MLRTHHQSSEEHTQRKGMQSNTQTRSLAWIGHRTFAPARTARSATTATVIVATFVVAVAAVVICAILFRFFGNGCWRHTKKTHTECVVRRGKDFVRFCLLFCGMGFDQNQNTKKLKTISLLVFGNNAEYKRYYGKHKCVVVWLMSVCVQS